MSSDLMNRPLDEGGSVLRLGKIDPAGVPELSVSAKTAQ